MKNFYEATVIKHTLTSEIEVTLTPVEQCQCMLLINNQVLVNEILESPKTIQYSVQLGSPITIQADIKRQHPQAIEIEVSIDGYPIIPLYQHLAVPSTDYIDFNGAWKLEIPHFYSWYHEVSGQGWTV